MRRVALRGLLARKTRLLLTALAVALGVTLIAGTYVFTDTINASFDKIFSASYAKTDVVITPGEQAELSEAGDFAAIPEDTVEKVRAVPGVDVVEGGIFDGSATFLTKEGEPFSLQGPKFVSSVFDDERFGGITYEQGRAPATAGEVALDKSTAEREGFGVGDRFEISADSGRKTYAITGITVIAGVDSFGGAAVAQLTLPEAQSVTGRRGFDEIDIALEEGANTDVVVAAIQRVVPAGLDVRTGSDEASSQSADIREDLGPLNTALLAFAGISLFVGAFIIFNTFSITVTQRAREFALLRTLGASRAQVLRSVLTEGAVLGVLGSAVGLALGILVAAALRELFKAVGFELPSGDAVIATRTIVVSLGVGILVTILACVAPALRATRVPPVAAMREGVALPDSKSSRLAFPAALGLAALGVTTMVVGLFAGLDESAALTLVGVGAALTFLGVALLSPRLVGPIASVVGKPLEVFGGMPGRLARENSVRQPGRTAVTASALMVGVALVCFASIFTAGFSSTIEDTIRSGIKADAVVQNESGFGAFSAEATAAVAGVDGVQRVSALKDVQARVDGETEGVTGVDPATFGALYDLDVSGLTDDGVVLGENFATDQGLEVGERLTLVTPTGKRLTPTVLRIAEIDGLVINDIVMTSDVVERDFGQARDYFILIDLGGEADEVPPALASTITEGFPQIEALTIQEYQDDQGAQVTQLLSLIYALLALAIIVSLFGIVNTLVLSITERTRELGMLRAIGTSRRQVRRMVRYESVITALIGGVLGIVLGVLLAVLVTRPIDNLELTFPYVTLLVVLLLAGLAGVLAAVLPARRASRLDVLKALAYE